MRQSSALIAADLPNAPEDVCPYATMAAARETALNAQLAILAASSQSSRVGEIDRLVDRPVSNIKIIQRGRPDIALFTGAQLLRDDAPTNVLNLRASYHQE